MKLTDTACKNAKPKDKPYKLSDGGGMYLHVKPHGSKLWRLKYRMHGKENTLGLGSYPETSLAEAREEREKIRKLIKAGIDPSLARKEEKLQARESSENTFELVAREWHEHQKARWTERHGNDVLHRLEMDVFPEIGPFPIRSITPNQVLKCIQKIEDRGAHELARRALQVCGQVFRYGIPRNYVESDPTRDLKPKESLKPFKKEHFACFDVKELPEFLGALNRNKKRLYPQTIRAIKLLMLTFVRTSELIGAKWEEIDLEAGQWLIPAERMKMRRDHIVPLSRQAVELLREQQESTGSWEWVFPNLVKPKNHMSNNTILMALKRMGYGGKMTGHGFRALAMSNIKEQLGYRHEVIDRQLAHAHKNKVDAAYDRAQFLKERTEMMQRYADFLDALASGGKVIHGDFKRRA